MALRPKPKKLDSNQLWDYALKVLARRAHSAAELKGKLFRRAETVTDLQAVMSKLREYGLTDDATFSEAFAQSRLQSSGFGRQRVLRDLRQKRVSDAVATSAVDRAYSGHDEPSLIQAFLERKYRGQNLAHLLREEKRLASVYRRLRTAGFQTSTILAVLKSYASNLDTDWSEPEEPEDA